MKIVSKQLSSHDCIICGVDNELGVKAMFYNTDDGKVITNFHFHFEHQSYPGRTHGGMICALLDELVGRAIWVNHPELWGVTMNLDIKYRKPVPYETELRGVGEIINETSRTFTGRGYIEDLDGNVLAEAEAIYMKLPIEKIAPDPNDQHAQMFMVPDDK